ncbi:MAG TPA: dihydropteroate synthase [Pelomicrobium sp.]|nr:dihydropteroate synthase [Pelomicrobium sp.]
MGVVNVTPDSFSDGGRFATHKSAAAQAERLVAEGADLLDIGGESSRPGAEPVSASEELARVLPVLEDVARLGVPVSVDTAKPEVMAAVIGGGAAMINDITALQAGAALKAAAAADVGVCVMHMRGEPRTMQQDPRYEDVVAEVAAFLAGRVAALEAAGVDRGRIVVDPGFGFGKTLEHNLQLLRHLPRLRALGVPVLAGLSRKSMLGKLTGRDVGERVHASVAAALCAAERGAAIIRVHDVAATRDALTVWQAAREGTA